MKNGAYQKWKKIFNPTRWLWTRKRQEQSQIWKVFLKKDMSGGCQSFPHSPRSVPPNFDVNSEPELIEGNISRAEPFPSGSNRNISVPIQKLVQRSKRRGVGNMPKPLAGGHELLLTDQELSGQGQKDKELVEEPKSSIHRPEEGTGNDSRFGERRPVVSTSSKPASEVSKDKPKGPQKNQRGPKNHQGKGKGKANWHRPYPQGCKISKLEPSAVDSVLNMARTLMEFTAKEQEKINRTFPCK
ncbi:hypothetical protein O181_077392 [Austropuccinia psidii MF-1]|uniref:Uncharacterized protein n=1 Tax=Austropuccinia psidii MF-1 TaxID=1389203 RepID=A0A9Q3FIK4_9BASI|nr:hypothetical protein [Austropuccinia psidii MF-1]